MTNAEAIETLRANYPDACYEQLREAVDAAIEVLKAQDAAGDTISRQAAIDIERNATVDTNPSHFEAHQKFTQFMDDAEVSSFGRWQWSNGFNTALTAVGIDLKKLPSAQPETNCSEIPNNSDTIYRQAAIDALMVRDKELRNINWYDKPYAEGECRGIDEALAIVSNLPSAQPDRDIPVKPIGITDSAWGIPNRQAICPKCDYYLMKVYFIPNDTADTAHSRKVSYCGNCGQAIDWSEWEDEE